MAAPATAIATRTPAPVTRSRMRARMPASTTTDTPEETLRALAALPARHPSRPAVRAAAIEAWLPLARQLAHRFTGRGEPVQDLVQTAVVGLIKAIDRFDLTRGDGFVAFAVPTIVGEIKRYFRDQAWALHVPRRVRDLRPSISETTIALTQRLGHPPSPAEIALDLRVPEDDVREGLGAGTAYAVASLDAPARDHLGAAGPTLGELLGEEDTALARAEVRLTVRPAVAALPERERRILMMRFYDNLTQDQIAARIGISQMHVSRLLHRTLAVLRQELA